MSKITEVAYAALFTRYREASMLADKYELIAKTHQDINKSLRKTNDDLRRMLREEDEKNDELRELLRDTLLMVDEYIKKYGLEVGDANPYDVVDAHLDSRLRKVGIEVGE